MSEIIVLHLKNDTICKQTLAQLQDSFPNLEYLPADSSIDSPADGKRILTEKSKDLLLQRVDISLSSPSCLIYQNDVAFYEQQKNQIETLDSELIDVLQKSKMYETMVEESEQFRESYCQLYDLKQTLFWEFLPKTLYTSIPLMALHLVENSKQIGVYKMDKLIGEGHYASVYMCRKGRTKMSSGKGSPVNKKNSTTGNSSENGDIYAVKVIDKDRITDIKALERIHSEIEALQNPALLHEGLLHCTDILHTSKYLYFITELGGKDLFDYFDMEEDGILEEKAKDILCKIIPPIYHLHSHAYCHRDLKPENILLNEQNQIKIIDFGLAIKMKDKTQEIEDFCGSPGFFAPEILLNDHYNGQTADIWSIGCIILELIVGHVFFMEKWMNSYSNELLQYKDGFQQAIQKSLWDIQDLFECHEKFANLSKDFQNIILKMLCFCPKQRITITELAEHPFFSLSDELFIRSKSNPSSCEESRLSLKVVSNSPKKITVKSSDLTISGSPRHTHTSPQNSTSYKERNIKSSTGSFKSSPKHTSRSQSPNKNTGHSPLESLHHTSTYPPSQVDKIDDGADKVKLPSL